MRLDPVSQLPEIDLQPIFAKGDLVADNWWTPPAPAPEPVWRRHALLAATFVLPVAVAAVYFFAVAANQFASETRFMVRGPSASLPLSSLINDQKVARASDETFAVGEYLLSRDALRAIMDKGLSDIFSGPKADVFNRFPNFLTRNSAEARYRHFRGFVEVTLDPDSGIATLSTRAFSPQDALALNKALLAGAQGFVNQLNEGVFTDTLKLASRHVDEARAQFAQVEARLTDYRNRESVVDPTRESAEQLGRIGELMSKLSGAESELSKQNQLAPRSPHAAALASEIDALRGQLEKQRAALSGSRDSLATKFAEFDKLMLDRLLASKALELALDQMQRARRDLEQRQYYLQTVVQPNLPDQPAYPRRLLDTLLVAGACLCLYLILNSVLTNLREHRA